MNNRAAESSFSYRLRRLRSLFTWDGFATSSLWTQGLLILILGLVVVFGFSPFIGSVKLSAQMFMKTAGVEALETWPQLIFGTINFFLGLLVFSLVITILTSALNQFIDHVKEGTLPFKYNNHIVIINANDMLLEVLSEINDRAASTNQVYRVVILVPDSEAVDRVWKQLPQKPLLNIEIFVRQGNLYSPETFKRINLCGASGALFLHNYEKEDAFSRDSDTIKSLLALVGWSEFISAVHGRQKARNPFKFVAESSGTVGCERIIRETGLVDGFRPFLGANPLEVADHLLGRAIADSRFYDIFQDIFSFDGHEIYFLDPGKLGLKVEGKSFRDLAYGFTRGIVIGRSRFEHGDFDIRLGPIDEVLKAGDWLVVLAEDESTLCYDPHRQYMAFPEKLPQPKEIVFRRICMLGNKNSYPSLTTFLDEESRAIFKENQFIFDEVEKYFDPALYEKIRASNFDTVVINLEEKYALRVASFIPTLFPADDPFLRKIVTLIENPLIDELLNSDSRKHNTILSRRLCAKYLTQILFQKNLVQVINELCAPEGYEFNLMEVGEEISKDKLQNKDDLRALLLGSNMIYLGFFDHENKLCFDSEELSRAKTLIVLANGEF